MRARGPMVLAAWAVLLAGRLAADPGRPVPVLLPSAGELAAARARLAAALEEAPYAVGAIPGIWQAFPEPERNDHLAVALGGNLYLPVTDRNRDGPRPCHRLLAVRGEAESVQLCILAGGNALRGVQARVEPLNAGPDRRGFGGQKDDTTVQVVGRLRLRDGRWWPDPLLPEFPVDVPAGRVQALWLTLTVPRDQPPGVYDGAVTVAPAGLPAVRIPLQLEVLSPVLPLTPRFTALVGGGLEWWYRFWELANPGRLAPDRGLTLYREHLRFWLAHRMSDCRAGWAGLRLDGEPGPEAVYDLREPERTLAGAFAAGQTLVQVARFDRGWKSFPALPGAAVRFTEPPGSPGFRAEAANLLRQYNAMLAKHGWLDRGFVWAWDEPPPQYEPVIVETMDWVRDVAPGLLRLCPWDHPTAGTAAHLDVIAAHQGRKNRRGEAVERILDRRANPRAANWFYTSGWPVHSLDWEHHAWPQFPPLWGGPNSFIDYPLADSRLMFWVARAAGQTGWLDTDVLCWYPQTGILPAKGSGNLVLADYRDPCLPWILDPPDLYSGRAGELVHAYPHPDGRLLSSLRLQAMRDGLEDVDAQACLADLAAARGDAEGMAAARIDPDLVRDCGAYTLDAGLVLARRERVLRAWDRLARDGPEARPAAPLPCAPPERR